MKQILPGSTNHDNCYGVILQAWHENFQFSTHVYLCDPYQQMIETVRWQNIVLKKETGSLFMKVYLYEKRFSF